MFRASAQEAHTHITVVFLCLGMISELATLLGCGVIALCDRTVALGWLALGWFGCVLNA